MPYRLSKYDSLLEVIPEELRTPEQVAQWRGGHQTPTYKLRRDPRNFCEVERYEEMTAIWMENETLVQVTQGVRFPHFDKFQNVENSLRLVVALFNPTRNIVIEISGKADDAVADTAIIDNQCDKFDFGTIKIKHLATLFARNPTRRLRINGVKLNSDQLSFLATRDHPIDLTFEYSNVLEDEGDAFVRSLQIRELPFGSLHFLGTAFPISDDNVERLVQLPIFDKLTLPEWDDDREFLPFSAPVRALEYRIHTSKVQAANIQAINVVPEDLTVKIWIDDWDDGEEEATLSLLSRLAGSGQLHHLGVKFEGGGIDFVEPNHSKSISEELIKTVLANKELVSLDIDVSFIFQQVHLTEFLESLDDHKALHTVTIEVHEEDVDFSDSSWLKILLSRNRRIEIYGDWMLSVMNWDDLHKVHSFNRFYTGCKSLKESTRSFRTKMLVTALEECASHRLLADQLTDSLCELIQSVILDVDDLTDEDESEFSVDSFERSSRMKRIRTDYDRK